MSVIDLVQGVAGRFAMVFDAYLQDSAQQFSRVI